MHLAAVVGVVLAGKAKVGVLRGGAIDSTVLLNGANLGQIARGQPADDLLAVTVEEVALGCTSNRALHVVVFGRGNSDTRHGSKDGIFFDGLAHRALKLVEVHAACLLHDFRHTSLTLLKRLDRIVLGGKFFAAAAHAAASEINLAKRKLSGGVLGRVDLLKDLKIAELGMAFVLSMRKFGVLPGARSTFQIGVASCCIQVRRHLA